MEPPENQTTLVLVEAAARTAAEHTLTSREGRARQRKVIVIACLCSLVLTVLVALPAAYFLDRDRQSAALERARFNCEQRSEVARIEADNLQIATDLRRKNARVARSVLDPDAIRRVFGSDLIAELYIKQAANERAAARDWGVNMRLLKVLAETECDKVLLSSGVQTSPTGAPAP